ncbi:hypothetical protein NOR51B_1904 [Luminiphilus syltensis NOR5-1B]|uniref:Uncharacterized protein n=1 Tax=Luminiphilus syltensis NOR5-1B TaxID=565045 RepID=B8KXP8_9GAMM|nr:hypothetical protein NOR51B_1904 [Luminiphilus syltensis NOR5-1B]
MYGRHQQSDEEYSQTASELSTYNDRLPVPGTDTTRRVVIGELDASEQEIDFSLDPATGKPFPGMEQTQRFGTF